jgi:peptidyl-tRNA hydrolase, PTH2 family
MSKIKQIIVMRRDLKMRRGKEVAQGSHSSSLWLVDRITGLSFFKLLLMFWRPIFTKDELTWLMGSFSKVCCQIDSEEELLNIFNKAIDAKLLVYLVTDSGLTEFGGVPTRTCLAIGPNKSEEIDKITGHLKLY